jgi:hypothetical protein
LTEKETFNHNKPIMLDAFDIPNDLKTFLKERRESVDRTKIEIQEMESHIQ